MKSLSPQWVALSALFVLLSTTSVMGQNETIGPTGSPTIAPTLFDACAIDTYYMTLLEESADATNWTRDALALLVKETHRNILPTHGKTAEDDDLYQALIDLNPGSTPESVRLIYRDIDADEFPHANPLYWEAERLWPRNRGYDSFSPAFTDVHHIRPAKATVLMSKGNLSFGLCDTVEYPDECIIPATTETANDTAQDGKIWTPPVRFRGEIARALFYMDLRYQQLNLQDCGPFVNAMGYRSQMLEWHADYPPTEEEMTRNYRSCSRWQGNRNPFIDYPELAQSMFGTPEQIEPGTRTYPTCIADFPTMAPTNKRNDCGSVRVGDVPAFLVNTIDPDEVVFLPMFDIPGDMDLYITDQAWNGTELITGVPNEGTMMMTTPEDGIEQGMLFGMGPGAVLGDTWSDVEGAFSLSTAFGDNIFLYCIDADDKIRFLAGFSNSGNWSLPGLTPEEYGEALTALPEQLEQASIILPHLDNYFYNGSRDETIALLRADMLNPASWVGDNEGRFSVETARELPDGVESSAFSITRVVSTFVGALAAMAFL